MVQWSVAVGRTFACSIDQVVQGDCLLVDLRKTSHRVQIASLTGSNQHVPRLVYRQTGYLVLIHGLRVIYLGRLEALLNRLHQCAF